MIIQQDISLRPFNTFGIDVKADRFARFTTVAELEMLLTEQPREQHLVLGGGSNVLFTGDVKGWVLKNEIAGIRVVRETDDHVYLSAGAGENWHCFVQYCIEHDLAGVENLSLIPGCVGASPMQNIGAYGVEIKDVFEELTAYHIAERRLQKFSLRDCEFGYRESIFKRRYKGEFIITEVVYRLNKRPVFHTGYGAINEELEKMGVRQPDIRAISEAVIRIRQSKLPDPKQIGNAGSFFKNPSVAADQFALLRENFPAIVGYTNADGSVKLAAGWLIEQCGLKGYREADAGVHARQALVLVNYGHATGQSIFALSEKVIAAVREKFAVELEREVNIIGS